MTLHRRLGRDPPHLFPFGEAPLRWILTAALAGLTACTAAPAAIAPAAPPSSLPATALAPLTGFGYHNETSVAVDPHNPAVVVAAWQVPATIGASADSGRTWHTRPLPGTAGFQLSGDPSVVFDPAGQVYALYIAFDRPDDYDTLGRAAHRNGIFLNRSDDGGRTWWPAPAPVIQHPEAPGIPFEDKPMMAADGRGNVYVAWTQFRRHESAILFARSTDGGHSFGPPVEISDRPGSPRDSVGADEGTDVAVGADGTVYVVWSDSVGLWLDHSSDGGRTFGPDQLVQQSPDIVFDIPGVARANGYPSLELDLRSGRLYVEWVDRRSGHAAVWLTRSDDGGRSWSAPARIAPDSAEAEQFFAWLALDQSSGRLVTGFYQGSGDDGLRYLLGWSEDGGGSFRRREWSRSPFQGGGEFLGDYTGVTAAGGMAYGAWTEARSVTAGEPTGDPDRQPVHTSNHATQVVVGRAVW